MPTAVWNAHVKKVMSEKGLSFKAALKEASKTYATCKDKSGVPAEAFTGKNKTRKNPNKIIKGKGKGRGKTLKGGKKH
jgi:hypothetical protein